MFEGNDRVAVAAPRGHNKSTLASLGYVLYRAAHGLSQFVLLVSDTGDQARDLVGAIFKELLENPDLTKDFPHLSLPDAAHYRSIKVRRKASDFITIGGVRFAARGSGAGLRGLKEGSRRPDLIICDDLENDKNVATPRQRKKLLEWFQKSLSNLFGPVGGKLLVVGTILHKSSLLSFLTGKTAPEIYAKRVYKAIAGGKPLWRDAWPIEKLEAKRKEIGSRAFATEFLNTPAADGATIFKENTIRRNRVMRLPIGVTLTRILIGVDPSGTEKGDGDACGIIVAGLGSDGFGYVLEDATINGSPSTWGRRVLDLYKRYKANGVVIEQNYGGAMVLSVLKAELRPDEFMPWTALVTAKQGKSLRAEPISVQYENDRVRHVGHLPELEDEMIDWVPGMASPNRLDAAVYTLNELILTADLSLIPQEISEWSN
jgi:hypothetical protein